VRLGGNKSKISAILSETVNDVVIEASFWAKENKETLVSADYVKRAIKEIRYRSSMIRDHILDTVNRGQILIDLEGKKVWSSQFSSYY